MSRACACSPRYSQSPTILAIVTDSPGRLVALGLVVTLDEQAEFGPRLVLEPYLGKLVITHISETPHEGRDRRGAK
jgi:hypothetical protein